MNYVDLKKETLSVTYNNVTYSKEFYAPAISVTGVVDETHPAWNSTADYVVDDYVIVPELKSIYRCSVNNTGKFPVGNLNSWTFWGYLNSVNMFACDENIGAKTIGVDVIVTLPFSQSNTLGIVDTDFSFVNIKQINNDTSEEVVNFTTSSRDISCGSFAEYSYKPVDHKRKVIVDNLKWLPNSNLVITFIGSCEIGTIGGGLIQDLGMTMLGTSLEWETKSKIKVDEFTNFRTVLRYGKVRVLTVQLIFNIDEFNRTANKIDTILDKNILFVPTNQDKFSELITIAYMEKFKIPLDNPHTIQTTTTLIGVSN